MEKPLELDQVQAIVFDLGNVIIDLDFDVFYTNLSKVLNIQINPNDLPEKVISAISLYDKGQISTESFLWRLQQFNKAAEARLLVHAWNSLILEPTLNRINLLRDLGRSKRIFLLSNNNQLHYNRFKELLVSKLGVVDFDSIFEVAMYSHLIGRRKPDKDIYSHANDIIKLEPSKVLFYDDLLENVLEAQRFGWQSYHWTPGSSFEGIITNHHL